jgi:hypothetical protein
MNSPGSTRCSRHVVSTPLDGWRHSLCNSDDAFWNGQRGRSRRGSAIVVALVAVAGLTGASAAQAHLERPTTLPSPARGSVPAYMTKGTSLVVCKRDSRRRISRGPARVRARNWALLKRCRYAHIRGAVRAATSGSRIFVLPGNYREEPSRAAPNPDPRCKGLLVPAADNPRLVPGYAYQRRCPNAQNLIAIVGDTNDDGICDRTCNLQIEGMGASPKEVVIEGDRVKANVIRADRADGFQLHNLTVQYANHNNVYVIETNGFRLERVISRWAREYAFLSFSSDHGLYGRVVGYGAGDAGIYTGSGPQGHCSRYGIEVRNSDAYGSMLGWSGASGDGIWIHDNRFHNNAVGLVSISVLGHPGAPQDCSKFERNRIYSNNLYLYSGARMTACAQPGAFRRDPRTICPQAQVPTGTGLVIGGGNDNLVRENLIYDNWRRGVMLFFVPAFFWGGTDMLPPQTSHQFVANRMGVRPDGSRDRNGVDFWWDGEGTRNCWSGNSGSGGTLPTSVPALVPACPGSSVFSFPDRDRYAEIEQCAPAPMNPFPPCPWTTRPTDPG